MVEPLPPDDPHRSGLRFVVEALNAGKADAAREACIALLARNPGDPPLNQLAATAALRTDRYEEARDFARRSLAARPDHVPTLLLAGRAARSLNDQADAVAVLTRAVQLAPGSAEAAFLLAAARLHCGEAPETLDLNGLAARFPGEVAGWEDLAEAALTRGRRDTALLCLFAAERTAPSFALSMRRGLVLKDLGRPAEARRAFAQALTLDPGAARAWFLIGVVSQDLRDMAAAEEAYGHALALDPMLAEAAVNLGTSLQERGDLDGAKAAYAKAVRMRPDTFGRVAQAMTTSPRGELWLDLRALHRALAG